MKFEILEHTADIGFAAWGATFAELLDNASQAMSAIILELETVEPRIAYTIAASGEDREALLVNWLSEVLYYIDGRGIALRRCEITKDSELKAAGTAWGEPRSEKHPAKLIVKGVTYHQLLVQERSDGWYCRVFLDI